MIVINSNTEVIYFRVYDDYFNFPRNKTSPHNSTGSYLKKNDSNGGIFFIEYDFFIIDDFTKEPFFVYRVKNSFTFIVENEEKDLIDLGVQKAKFREETLTFIRHNSMGYHFENLEHLFYLYNSLDLITTQGFYSKIEGE